MSFLRFRRAVCHENICSSVTVLQLEAIVLHHSSCHFLGKLLFKLWKYYVLNADTIIKHMDHLFLSNKKVIYGNGCLFLVFTLTTIFSANTAAASWNTDQKGGKNVLGYSQACIFFPKLYRFFLIPFVSWVQKFLQHVKKIG